jgi:hypothetical protein
MLVVWAAIALTNGGGFSGPHDLVVAQVVTGAVLGVFSWTLFAPGSRIRRAAVVLVTINCLAWLTYLVFTPRVPESEFEEIARRRAAHDAGRESIDLIHDGPSVLAGRESGSWAVRNPHRFLVLMAGPAISFAESYVVPAKYLTTMPTRAESYWIAAIGFVLSTAWWTTVGTAIPWIRQIWRRRREKRI